MRKAEAQIELNTARDVNGSQRGSLKYVIDKRKTRENVGPLLKKIGAPDDTGHGKG